MVADAPLPACHGTRTAGPALVAGRLVTTSCPTCDGAGEITEQHAARREYGGWARAAREAAGIGLRRQADRLGVSPTWLSRFERGRWEAEG